jgi:hypothetical protein
MSFNNCQWVELRFCIIVASQLTVAACRMPALRHTEGYRRSLDMKSQFEKVISCIDQMATDQRDLDGERDCFHYFRRKISHLQKWFERQTKADSSLDPVHAGESIGAEQGAVSNLPVASDLHGVLSASASGQPASDTMILTDESFGTWANPYSYDICFDNMMMD